MNAHIIPNSNNKINFGKLSGETWKKTVNWNKAVLWKERKISFNLKDVQAIRNNPVKHIEFHDRINNRKYITTKDKLLRAWKKEQHFQEPQYYCPIELFEVEQP